MSFIKFLKKSTLNTKCYCPFPFVLVSGCCYNKLPQIWWLKTIQIYLLTVWRSESKISLAELKSKGCQEWLILEALGGESTSLSFLTSRGCLHSSVSSSLPPLQRTSLRSLLHGRMAFSISNSPASLLQGPLYLHQAHLIIQVNLFISRFSTISHLQSLFYHIKHIFVVFRD